MAWRTELNLRQPCVHFTSDFVWACVSMRIHNERGICRTSCFLHSAFLRCDERSARRCLYLSLSLPESYVLCRENYVSEKKLRRGGGLTEWFVRQTSRVYLGVRTRDSFSLLHWLVQGLDYCLMVPWLFFSLFCHPWVSQVPTLRRRQTFERFSDAALNIGCSCTWTLLVQLLSFLCKCLNQCLTFIRWDKYSKRTDCKW